METPRKASSRTQTTSEMHVAVRVRPINEQERAMGCTESVQISPEMVVLKQPDKTELLYTFDTVFGPMDSNEDVYRQVADAIVLSCLSGINGAIIAYGQTASGKTHCIQGNASEIGIIDMASSRIFEQANQEGASYHVTVTYLEVYREKVRDLLRDGSDDLRVREDPQYGFRVEGLEEMPVSSASEVRRVFNECQFRRQVAGTDMNEFSSRSHTIFTIQLLGTRMQDEGEAIQIQSKLCIVDLAGSENIRATNAEGERSKEGGLNNKSLLALSMVVSNLANQEHHVRFRDSRLTQILQPCLSGNCRSAIICCVSPASRFLSDTSATLKFASSARKVKTKYSINEVAPMGGNETNQLVTPSLSDELRMRNAIAKTEREYADHLARLTNELQANEERFSAVEERMNSLLNDLRLKSEFATELESRTLAFRENSLREIDILKSQLNNQMESLRENEMLKARIKELEESFIAIQQDNVAMKQDISAKDETIEITTSALVSLKSESGSLVARLHAAEEESSKLKEELNNANSKLAMADEDVNELRGEVDTLNEKVLTAELDSKRRENEHEEFQVEMERLVAQLDEKSHQMEEINSEWNKTRSELEQVRFQSSLDLANVIEKERTEFESKLEDMQVIWSNKLNEANARIVEVEQDRDERLQASENELAAAKQHEAAQMQQMTGLKERQNELEASLHARDGQIHTLEEEMTLIRAERDLLLAKQQEDESKMSSVDELEKTKSDLIQAIGELEQTRKEKEKLLLTMAEQQQQFQQELDRAKDDAAIQSKELLTVREHLDTLKLALDTQSLESNQELEAIRIELAEKDSEIARLESGYEQQLESQLMRARETSRVELQNNKVLLEEMETKLKQNEEDVEEMRLELTKKAEELSAARQTVESLLEFEKSAVALMDDLSKANQLIEELKFENQQLKDELVAFEQRMSRELSILKDERDMAQEKEHQLSEELSEQQRLLETERTQYAVEINGNVESASNLKQELEQTQSTLNSREEECSGLQARLNSKETELEQLRTLLSENTSLKDDFQSKLETANQRVENLMKELITLQSNVEADQLAKEALGSEQSGRLSELEQSLVRKDEALQSFELMLKDREADLATLQIQIDHQEQLLQSSFEVALNEKSSLVSKLEKDLTEKDERLSSLQVELEITQQKYADLSVQLEGKGLELKSVLEDKQSTEVSHKQTIDQLKSNLEEKQRRESSLQQAIEQLNAELDEKLSSETLLQQKIDQSIAKLHEKESVEHSLQQTVDQLTARLEEEKQMIEISVQSAVSTSQQMIDQLTVRLGEKQAIEESLRVEISTAQQTIDQLTVRLGEKQAIEDSLRLEMETIQQTVGQLDVKLNEKQAIEDSLRLEMETIQQTVGQLDAKLKEKEVTESSLQLTIEQLSVELGEQQAIHLVIDQLKSQLDEKQEMEQSLRRDVLETQQTIDQLNASLAEKASMENSLEQTIHQLNATLEEKNQIILNFQVTRQKQLNNMRNLLGQSGEGQSSKQNQSAIFEEADSFQLSMDAVLKHKDDEIARLKSEQVSIAEDHAKLAAELKESQALLEDLRLTKQNLESMMEDVRLKASQFEHQLNLANVALENKSKELDMAQRLLESTSASFEAKLVDLKSEATSAARVTEENSRIEFESKVKEVAQLKDELAIHVEESGLLKIQLEERSNEMNSLQQSFIERLTEMEERLKQEEESQRQQLLNEREAEIQHRLENEWSQREAEWTEMKISLEREIEDHRQAVESLKQELNERELLWNDKLAEWTETRIRLEKDIEGQRQTHDCLKQELYERELQWNEMKARLESALAEKETRSSEVLALQEELDLLKANYHSKMEEWSVLQANAGSVKVELEQAHANLQNRSKELLESQAQLTILKDELKTSQETISALENELNKTRLALKDMNVDQSNALKRERDELERQFNEMREEMSLLEAKSRSQLDEERTRRDELECRQKEERELIEQTVIELTENLNLAIEEKTRLESQLTQLKQQADNKGDDLQSNSLSSLELDRLKDETLRASRDAARYREELDLIKSELERTIQQLMDERNKQEEETNRLLRDLQRSELEKKDVSEFHKEHNGELTKIQEELIRKKFALAEMESDLHREKTRSADLNTTLREIKKSQILMDSELQRFRNECDMQAQTIEFLMAEKERRSQELESLESLTNKLRSELRMSSEIMSQKDEEITRLREVLNIRLEAEEISQEAREIRARASAAFRKAKELSMHRSKMEHGRSFNVQEQQEVEEEDPLAVSTRPSTRATSGLSTASRQSSPIAKYASLSPTNASMEVDKKLFGDDRDYKRLH